MLHDLLLVLFGLIIGGIVGFFLARNYMKKYVTENPPITEDMLKSLMSGMGRTPNQKQINQMMKMMKAKGKK